MSGGAQTPQRDFTRLLNPRAVAVVGASPDAKRIGGHVEVIFSGVPSLLPHFQTGRLRAVAIGSMKRFFGIPNALTFDKSELKGCEATTWFGLMAPLKTPEKSSPASPPKPGKSSRAPVFGAVSSTRGSGQTAASKRNSRDSSAMKLPITRK